MGYISVAQAADKLNVSEQTIRNWVRWGIIKGLQVFMNPDSKRPGKILVDEESIDRAIATGKI
jgi:transposase